ncbi:hypothetical protein DID76_03640 [Candidatus Marinamargulisbacteria bacterium SCGC AG-414-C22]|nr:hypothetical protein DID76_03640 [Candidatus Marinamargulisbacteria bacterium SCGC AG-414-C22]
MTVTFLCQLFYPELISTGLTLTELAEEMVKQGQRVSVICAQPTLVDQKTKIPSTLTHRGITIKRLPATRFAKKFFWGKLINHITFFVSALLACLKLPKYSQLVLLTNPPILPFIMLLLYPIKKFKYTILVFDVYPNTAVAAGLLHKKHPIVALWKRFNTWVYSKAHAVICIGDCMATILRDDYNHHLTTKLHTLSIWCDDHAIRTNKGAFNFKETWDLTDKFIVGYAGNLARFHDIESIIYAAEQLQHYHDIVFLFVGEGHKKDWAKAYAEKNKLTNCIFKTYVKRKHLGALLHQFDLGLVSLESSQTGLSVPSKTLGLMAAGCPILAIMDEYSTIAKMVTAHTMGYVCKPQSPEIVAEIIEHAHKNASELTQFGKNSYTVMQEKYNLTLTTAQFLNILSSP